MTLQTAYTLATLAELKAEIGTGNANDDDGILDAGRTATARIEEACKATFVPYMRTIEYDRPRMSSMNGLQRLSVNGDLLHATEVCASDGKILVEGTDYKLPLAGHTPYLAMLLKPNISILPVHGSFDGMFKVTGLYGYHHEYPRAFKELTTVTSVSGNTITVGDGTEFEPGQFISIGGGATLEFATVLKVTTNVLNLDRAINGTEQHSHAAGAKVKLWTPQTVMAQAARRLGAYLYHRRGKHESTVIEGESGTVIKYPTDMPKDVQSVIEGFLLSRQLWVAS